MFICTQVPLLGFVGTKIPYSRQQCQAAVNHFCVRNCRVCKDGPAPPLHPKNTPCAGASTQGVSGNNDRFSRQITAASLAHVTPQRDRLCTYKIFNAAVFFVEVRHHLGKAAPLVVHIVTGKGQRDGGARVGGFVDGSDQLNGLAAFGTVYKQSFFPTDRRRKLSSWAGWPSRSRSGRSS